jgi:uncharacterized protein
MILLDVNLLVHAYDANSRHHAQTRPWWENQLNGSQMIGLSWVAVLCFIRLLTNPRIYQQPYSAEEVVAIVGTWFQQPHVKIIHPADQHFTMLAGLIRHLGTAGNLTTDAHLAALAVERGLILQTTNADFARFPGLKWHNPLNH